MKLDSVFSAGEAASLGRAKIEAIATAEIAGGRFLWHEALEYLSQAFNHLYRGAGKGNSRPWVDGIRQVRERDELLRYMKEARDAKHHGSGDSAKELAHFVGERPREPGDPVFGAMTLGLRTGGTVTHDPPINNKWLVSGLPITTLVPVTTREGTFAVPRTHLGMPLTDTSPLAVGRLAFDYIQNRIDEAFHMPEPGER